MKAKISRGKGFRGLLKYVLQRAEAAPIGGNMASDSVDGLTAEFGAIRACRRDIQRPVWHASLALPAGEYVDADGWQAIAAAFLDEMGLADHQWVAARHSDTEHDHIHIVVNRIRPDGEIWFGRYEARRAIEVTQRLESRFGLTLTPGLDSTAIRGPSGNEIRRAARTGEAPVRARLQSAIDKARERSDSFTTFVYALADLGISMRPNGKMGTVAGCSFELDGIAMAGSKLGKACSWKRLAERVHYDEGGDAALIAELRAGNGPTIAPSEPLIEETVETHQPESSTPGMIVARLLVRGNVASRDQILEALGDAGFDPGAELLRLSDQLTEVADHLYTSPNILAREQQMLADARALAADDRAPGGPAPGTTAGLSREQTEAVAHACRSRFSIIQGSAGAGKTHSVRAIRDTYERAGYRVLGVAIAKRASQVLGDEAGIATATVAKLLYDLEHGQRRLDHRSVIVIDEAGQIGSHQMATLLSRARAACATVIATGEDRQLDAIERGGALHYLSRHVDCAHIQTIRRQRHAWAREISANLRDGRSAPALHALNTRGLLEWCEDRGAAANALFQGWRRYDQSNPGQGLILAHANRDVRIISRAIRQMRRDTGLLSGPDHRLAATHSDQAYHLDLAVGDRVKAGRNDPSLGLINGTLGTLASIEALNGGADYRLVIATDDGARVAFNTSEYSDDEGRVYLAHAYALTIYSAQGVTVPGDVFVLATPGMSQAETYVAASRAKDATHLYAAAAEYRALGHGDPLNGLIRATARDRHTHLASSYLEARGDSGDQRPGNPVAASESGDRDAGALPAQPGSRSTATSEHGSRQARHQEIESQMAASPNSDYTGALEAAWSEAGDGEGWMEITVRAVTRLIGEGWDTPELIPVLRDSIDVQHRNHLTQIINDAFAGADMPDPAPEKSLQQRATPDDDLSM